MDSSSLLPSMPPDVPRKEEAMKELQLVYKTAANTTRSITISNPKDGLTKEEAKEAAEKIMPVLVNQSGVEMVSFVKAVVTTTTQQELT